MAKFKSLLQRTPARKRSTKTLTAKTCRTLLCGAQLQDRRKTYCDSCARHKQRSAQLKRRQRSLLSFFKWFK